MAFEFDLNKVKSSLVNAGKEVESMAKDASSVAKIKIDIHNKEVFLEKQYALLGKAYYEAHKDEEVEEITEEDFARRMILSEVCISTEGDFDICYDDDDMFWGHVIIVSGNIRDGISGATIAG